MADPRDPGRLLFLYGTLRPGGNAAGRLAGRGRWLGPTTTRGRLYRITYYPALVGGDGVVRGDLFEMDDPAALLPELDAYEGCGPGDAEPWEYRRAQIAVDSGGTGHAAWAYLYNWPVDESARIESGDFLSDSRFRS